MVGDDPLDLDKQIALVCGAGEDVGRAITLSPARHNPGGIAVNDFVPERAESVKKEFRELRVAAIAVPSDVCDLEAVRSAAQNSSSAGGPYPCPSDR